MAFLATCLSCLIICNFWGFFCVFLFFGFSWWKILWNVCLFFYLISLKLGSGLSSSHLYVPFIIVQQT